MHGRILKSSQLKIGKCHKRGWASEYFLFFSDCKNSNRFAFATKEFAPLIYAVERNLRIFGSVWSFIYDWRNHCELRINVANRRDVFINFKMLFVATARDTKNVLLHRNILSQIYLYRNMCKSIKNGDEAMTDLQYRSFDRSIVYMKDDGISSFIITLM